MEVTVEVLDGLERRLKVTVPAKEFDDAYQAKLKSAQKTIKMDGFRAGKVPATVVESKFGESISAEVVGELIDKHFQAAVENQKQKPAGQPKLDDMPEHKAGEPFTFSVTYEVFPEFDLVELNGKSVDKEEAEIQDKDIETTITRMRDQHATWIPVDRPAKSGDQIIIDFEGSIDGEKFEGGTSENFELTLGSGQMIPGFEDALMGAGADDETTINVTFPEEYQAEHLAGKPADFAIKVHQVLEKQPLEDDAELLKKLDIKGDMQALRDQVKKHMSRELDSVLTNRLHEGVFNQLVEANSFDVPKSLVQQEAKNMVQAQMQQYLGADALKKLGNVDLPLDPYLEPAEKRIRLGIMLEKLIEKHNIKADSAKVRTYVEKVAEAYDDATAVINHYYNSPEAMAGIKNAVVEATAIETLLANMTVNNVKTDYETLIGQQAQQ
jgi:trigger factor